MATQNMYTSRPGPTILRPGLKAQRKTATQPMYPPSTESRHSSGSLSLPMTRRGSAMSGSIQTMIPSRAEGGAGPDQEGRFRPEKVRRQDRRPGGGKRRHRRRDGKTGGMYGPVPPDGSEPEEGRPGGGACRPLRAVGSPFRKRLKRTSPADSCFFPPGPMNILNVIKKTQKSGRSSAFFMLSYG